MNGNANYVSSLRDGQLISHYLMCCYLYYVADTPVLTDEAFDLLCKRLIDKLDSLNHNHKHLVKPDLLKCNSGFDIEFPTLTINAAHQWAGQFS